MTYYVVRHIGIILRCRRSHLQCRRLAIIQMEKLPVTVVYIYSNRLRKVVAAAAKMFTWDNEWCCTLSFDAARSDTVSSPPGLLTCGALHAALRRRTATSANRGTIMTPLWHLEYIMSIMTLLWHYYYTYHFYKSLTIITHYDKIQENTIITLMTVLLWPLLHSEYIMIFMAFITLLYPLLHFELL